MEPGQGTGCGAPVVQEADVDLLRAVGNHNYMNTRQEDPGSADDSAGTGEDEGRDSGSGSGGGKEKLRGWFTGRLPADWFTAAPDIRVDRDPD